MDSKVKSQISDKVYEATLDDLSEADQGLEVDLYKLNVFNKDIMIAPGKVISDAKKDVHYCYVYVIKDGRVAAKLGIYETHVKKGEVYDLTDFEGREFLLFDHYYNEPGTLVQYEMKEAEDTDNIFDYLKRFLKPVTNATAAIKEQRDMIRKVTKRLEGKPEGMTLKLFKKQKPYDEELLDSFKEEREDWMFILIVLEIVMNVKFIFEDSDGEEDKLRELVRTKENANAREPTSVIRVSLEDTPRHIVDAPKPKAKTALVRVEEEEELEPSDSFPSPDSDDIPISQLVKPEVEPKATFKTPVRSFSAKAEEKPVRSFSAKAEEKPVRSFSAKAEKPVRSFSAKAEKPARSFSAKAEEKPSAEPRAVSPSVRKVSAEPRAVSPSVKPSAVPRELSPSAEPNAETPVRPGILSKVSSGEKPRRIIRSAPPPKLKTLGENNA
jgi:hypothetical protein